jgi:hypothetical protein
MDNLRSPVSRLPPELLIKIFEYLVTRSSPAILLRICHRWTDIASSSPSLWTRIDLSTPPAPLIQRCVNRPIEVILPPSLVPTWKQLRAARDVLLICNDRIRKLALDLPERDLQALEPVLSSVFPILVDVSISVRQCDYGACQPEDVPEWKLVETLPSSIRYLRLLFVKTPWIPGRFQNLVEFFLHEQLCSDFNPPMEVFLEILDSSPQLAILSVANSGPRLPTNTTALPPPIRVVHLPNLQRLYLEQNVACRVGWMLLHLKIPASANVRISVELSSIRWFNVPAPEHSFDLALPDYPGLPHLTNLHRCTYGVAGGKWSTVATTNFAFSFTWDNTSRHFDNFMMPFLRRATAVGVMKDLTIIYNKGWNCGTGILGWKRIFDTLHSLRKLTVQQSPHDSNLSIQGLFESPSGPVLRELWLSCLVVGESGESWEEFTERLVNYCAERDRRGCRLERLVVETLYPPPDLGSLFAPYVDHFEIKKEDFRDEFSDSEWKSRQMSRFPRAASMCR